MLNAGVRDSTDAASASSWAQVKVRAQAGAAMRQASLHGGHQASERSNDDASDEVLE